MNVQGLAVAWFRKEDWGRWLAIDPDFQPDYDHWLQRMEDAIAALKMRGQIAETVLIDPDEFLAWSAANGGKVDSNTRAIFAAFTLANRTSKTAH